MLEVRNVKVYDFAESVVASGYAMGLSLTDFGNQVKALNNLMSVDHLLPNMPIGYFEGVVDTCKKFRQTQSDKLAMEWYLNSVSEKARISVTHLNNALHDIERCCKLVSASKNSEVKCHDNFLTGIRVSFDLIYPNYISPEMQRYHWFDIVTSSSKMHRITKMNFDECCNKYVTEETKENMKRYIEEYNSIGALPPQSDMETKERHNKEVYEAFMKVLSNCPQGVELFMRVSTNYKQLQTIYKQRKNHKLKEDWGAFCNFIEQLPFSRFITGDGL